MTSPPETFKKKSRDELEVGYAIQASKNRLEKYRIEWIKLETLTSAETEFLAVLRGLESKFGELSGT